MISLITAVDKNGLIGDRGKLPWHLPEELAFFKTTTWGTTLVMGRKTFESIGRPLPGRKTIVLTRDAQWHHEGVLVLHDVEPVLSLAEKGEEVMVAGGREVYNLFLPHADFLIQSVVEGDYKGDTYFPPLEDAWCLFNEHEQEGFTVKTYLKGSEK